MRRVGIVGLLFLTSACGGSGETRLVVGVAASMSEAARELADAYPSARIELSVAGSQILISQVREGAPLDVVITANAATARALVELGVVDGEPVRFARNRLMIAVAEGNPLGISGIEDLTDGRLVVVLAGPEVPAGAYTADLLEAAGVTLTPSSLEPSVRAVLAKVQLGEADAGIVYQTDVELGGGVSGVPIPGDINPITEYFAMTVGAGDGSNAAAEFVEFLRSSQAAAILSRLGFAP